MAQVRDVMTRDLQMIRPDSSIDKAAMEMKNNDIGALPVVENDRVVGMLTDRDIAIRVVAEGNDPKKVTVRDVMTQDVQTVYDDSNISDVTRLMKDQQIRRVVVVTRDNRPAGVCSLVDLAMSLDETTTGEVMKGMSLKGKKH